ncbi:Lsm12p PWA37_004617 [Arxiozyma heterogenica]|uniref:AD domain-containing protein n=1 Tax=Arxiozyma heterogenica TaxID=278026 RepID=A0AAN7WJ09_9SACH|nr:hypothetical protein RI543_000904 [Kazachstania heterogenica]
MSISLEHVIGFKVKVINLLDVITEGKIYSFNSVNNTITLQTSRKNQSFYDFRIIKCSFIKSLQVIGDKPSTNSFKKQIIKPYMVNLDRIETFLNQEIERSNKNSLLKGKGVTPEGQTIFDMIYKTIPDTRWDDKDIVILDDIKVVPPYKIDNIITLHETQSINLIEKIIERGWDNIKTSRDSTPISKDGDTDRKGG